jgi:uncharacterized protein YegP (UPF0339 family)
MSEKPVVVKVKVFRDHAGEYRWTAYAANLERVADSDEGYEHRADALAAATSLFPAAEIA